LFHRILSDATPDPGAAIMSQPPPAPADTSSPTARSREMNRMA